VYARLQSKTIALTEMNKDTPDPDFIRPRVAAGVLIRNEKDEVLMVTPSYKSFLDIPGGYVEQGETPVVAARREVKEEIGLDIQVGRLLVADWRGDSGDGAGGPKFLFVFDGGRLTENELDQIEVDGDEIIGYQFQPVETLSDVTISRLVIRIEQAVQADRDGTVLYLEDGIAPRNI